MTYAPARIMDEVAYVAAAYHWPLDTVLDLEHDDRAHFIAAWERLQEPPSEAEPS